jgi:hypothetical protein
MLGNASNVELLPIFWSFVIHRSLAWLASGERCRGVRRQNFLRVYNGAIMEYGGRFAGFSNGYRGLRWLGSDAEALYHTDDLLVEVRSTIAFSTPKQRQQLSTEALLRSEVLVPFAIAVSAELRADSGYQTSN